MTYSVARPFALLATALAVLAAMLTAPTPAVADEADPRAERAQQALATVERLMRPAPRARQAPQPTADGSSLTTALRDLYLYREHLDGSDAERAERILARPDGTGPYQPGEPPLEWEPSYGDADVAHLCTTVCVHWATEGPHAPAAGYPEAVLAWAAEVRQTYRDWGYRFPAQDQYGPEGHVGKVDIYLVDLEALGVLGYAAFEEFAGTHGASGYAVIDKDYRWACGADPCTNRQASDWMRATVGHEYFHLVQVAFTVYQDGWLMESTAMWMEGQIAPDVDHHADFLPFGIMRHPWVPLDHPETWYANWIFFQFLSERFNRGIVRRIWQLAPNRTSVRAVRAAVNERAPFERIFARFADANRRPHQFYDNSRKHNYPTARLGDGYRLTKANPRQVRRFELDRLSSVSFRVRPGNHKGRRWLLRTRIDGADGGRGYGYATIKRAGGKLEHVPLALGRNGRVVTDLKFGRGRVRWVEITIVNASVRYRCGLEGQWVYHTCQGRPLDDGQPHRLVTRAIRP